MPALQNPTRSTILVTGSNGFLATWVVNNLLKAGYNRTQVWFRERIVFPGHNHVGDDPAIDSTEALAIHYTSADHFVRRFWYGVIPVNGKVTSWTAGKPGKEFYPLFIECRSAEILMEFMKGSFGSTLAGLLVLYNKKAYVADYYSDINPKDDNDDYNAGGVREQIDKLIKDIGLERQIQPIELIDLLIREEFPMYKIGFEFNEIAKSGSLQYVISNGFEKEDM
ncbi:hypothetical protein K435DRAFT_868863 [Dendrothele bispora CBS 962.96]|uniref:NAD-dependent epimerase/dehydratase domain-containing protein n=1 Tax=Dendrothele bispora (strain CBS 962.96) TaxID=1314807 RepID=A0A4S8LAP3_DENBC|nr:hypothetical protein K435DRAFT_868863 [Dendrothele bispora CBS 962.96]